MSDLAPYVETGRVPIPIVTAIHVRSNVSTSLFYSKLFSVYLTLFILHENVFFYITVC